MSDDQVGAHLSEEEVRAEYAKLWFAAVRLCNAMRASYGGPETLDYIREKIEASRYN